MNVHVSVCACEQKGSPWPSLPDRCLLTALLMWMGRGTLTLRGKNFIVPEKKCNWLLLQIRASQTAFCEA